MFLTAAFFSICGILDFSCASNNFLSTDGKHAALPPLNHIDDYEKCLKAGKPFCRVIIKLTPAEHNHSSPIWKYIEQTKDKKNVNFFPRDELNHAICVEEMLPGGNSRMENIESSILDSYKKRLDHLGLIPVLRNVDCVDDDIKINPYDWIFLFAVISYLSIVAWATLRDFSGSYKSQAQLPDRRSYLKCFSLKNGWNKLVGPDKNIDSDNLKSFQGLRFYTTCFVVVGHTYSALSYGFKANPEYLENTSSNIEQLIMVLVSSHAVQTFFLMSSWLTSYHFLQVLENENTKKTRYVILSILNRYLRLIPVLTVAITLTMTTWSSIAYDGPLRRKFLLKEQRNCLKNWWTNLLFINNIYDHQNMCIATTWYIAAEFQLHVLSMVLLLSAWILKKKFKTFISLFFLFGVIVQSMVTYIYDTDFLFRLFPKFLNPETFLSHEVNRVYTSTYSNIATTAIGLGFGYIYFNKDKYATFLNSTFFRSFSRISFVSLMTIVPLISYYQYTKPITCLLAGLTKPLFAFGLGAGLLGMSHNVIFRIPKKILEWKPAAILGKLSFSTYIIHPIFVFGNLNTVTEPTFLSDHVLLTAYLRNLLLAFFLGFLAFLLVEQPMMQLQNLVIPQARNERREKLKDVNCNVKDK